VAGDAEALAMRLVGADGEALAAWRQTEPVQTGQFPGLKATFGAQRVLRLEWLAAAGLSTPELLAELARLGYEPAELQAAAGDRPAVYHENARAEAERIVRRLLRDESLRYGVACSETAFVAVRAERGAPVEDAVVVANALPAGWSDRFLAGAPGGGGGPFRMLAATAPTPAAAPASWPLLVRRRLPRRLAASTPPAGAHSGVVFAGAPRFAGATAVLFETRDQRTLPADCTLVGLIVRLGAGAPAPDRLDGQLELLVFVDDLTVPRARVRLVDLVRQGGQRPLNVGRRGQQVVQLALVDPAGAWAAAPPRLEVVLRWSI